MNILSTTILTETQKNEVIDLISTCQDFDGTHSDIYLSNEYNFDKDMPAFFLAYKQNQLVGFLSNYADEIDDAEISLIVHPNFRRRGIASELIKIFEKEINYLKNIYFKTEYNFIKSNRGLLDKWNLKIDEDKDIILERDREKYEIEKNPLWEVKKASLQDVDAIAEFQSKSFDMPIDVSLRYAKEPIVGENKDVYILKENGKVIASCSVDYSYNSNYLFGFATLEEKKRKRSRKLFNKKYHQLFDRYQQRTISDNG
ncbi:GNAT family N-acetyltransferase [Helcococcus kunzii]|uniref:GNAT family N-acetyltransferase n=1 Tax=Helcococcus kunzii TaxID=40091 RepID=UPI001C946B6A|nr:GNAT family N-acetyltransferase [Helcococcus kunzii]QZO76145.1 GNAT family N-acetyltransferase [Helcococcus kunzii]